MKVKAFVPIPKDHEKLMESSYFAYFTVIKFNGQEDTGKKKKTLYQSNKSG